jgi:recombinational DNA repair protein RecT
MENQIVPMDAIKSVIVEQRPQFDELARIHGAVSFQAEYSFALQILGKNDYLLGVALKNKTSLACAVLNVAAIGLTLNPALKLAYLVPRDGEVCLDISYMGLIQLAVESGSILWAQTELVAEKDTFEFMGVGIRPLHKFNPFGDRGHFNGGYVTAKTRDGDFLTTIMTQSEIYAIRDRSPAWISFKNGKARSCPWDSDEGEMWKKTLVKRGWKLWPKAERNDRLARAIEVSNHVDPVDFSIVPKTAAAESDMVKLKDQLASVPDGEKKLLKHVSDRVQRTIAKVDDMTPEEITYSVNFLAPYVGAKK